MFPHSPNLEDNAAQRSIRSGGFALVIALSLMAFIVLLLLTITTMVRVETRVSDNGKSQTQARQNALLALNIALGQLQKYAGPDQRVTATADLAAGDAFGARIANGASPDSTASYTLAPPATSTLSDKSSKSKGLSAVQAGTRFWTGVWGNFDAPSDIYQATPRPVFLNWLVSGNEDRTFTADVKGSSPSGKITASDGDKAAILPSLTISPALTNDPAKTNATTALTIGTNTPAVLLVGPNTAGTGTRYLDAPTNAISENAEDRYVVAPLVDIKASSGSATANDPVIGRYAYWISDEGVKAKYNLKDPYSAYNEPTNTSAVNFTTREGNTLATTRDALARYRLMSAPRNGLEGLVGLNYLPNDAKVERVLEPGQIRLAGSTTVSAAAQQQRIHDVTTTSMGLLANTLEGGLRKDLTAYLKNETAFAELGATNKIIPSDYSPTQGPNWGQLKSYHDLATSASTGAVDIRPATTTQMGIVPIVSDVRLLFGLKPADVLGSAPTPEEYENSEIQALFSPLIVLTNPYNRPLRLTGGTAGYLEMEFQHTEFANYPSGEWRGELLFKNVPHFGAWPTLRIASRLDENGNPRRPSLLHDVKFRFPDNIILQPGQSEIFTITSNQVDLAPEEFPTLTAGPPSGSTFHYYGKTLPGSRMDSERYGMEDGGNSSPLDIVFSNSSGVVKHLEGINVDYAGYGGTSLSDVDREPEAFVTGMFKASVSYPGDPAPGTNEANRNRTLRPFADFNLRAAKNRQMLWLYSLPPYYARWFSITDTPVNEVPTEFTNYLATGAYWGRDSTISLHETRLFDLPTPSSTDTEMSLLSLAQLQHADLTADDDDIGVGHQPGYAVGNSFAPPYLNRDQTKQQRPDWHSLQATPPYYTEVQHNYYDISYLLNCALWDKYFFSAVPQVAGTYESINARYRFVPDAALAAATAPAKSSAMHDPALSARYLMVDGAFNINSTSIEGWKALLGGSRGLNMPGDSQADAAFPRSVRQPGVATLPTPSGNDEDTYTGFRRLNDQQLTALATEIVKQVRLRGPFVSLAQFVNRSLTTNSASFALQGPLQSAINSAAGGINVFTEVLPTEDQVEIKDNPDTEGGSALTGTYRIFPITPEDPANELPPVSEQGYRSTAVPGWLTQADLLQVIGPSLSTRSDTFVIRTYGEVNNPLDDNAPPVARAWCEATVQRCPDYVDSGDPAERDSGDLTQPNNQTFGRKFEIVSFRWLSSEDI